MWLLSPPKRHTPRPPLLKEEGNFLPPLRGSAPRVPFRLTILEGPADHCLLQRLLGAKPIGLLQGSLGSQKIPKVLEDLGGGEGEGGSQASEGRPPTPHPPHPTPGAGPGAAGNHWHLRDEHAALALHEALLQEACALPGPLQAAHGIGVLPLTPVDGSQVVAGAKEVLVEVVLPVGGDRPSC